MKKMKLGIVGYGFMGHCDADMLKTFEDIELTAVADINPVQMEAAPEGGAGSVDLLLFSSSTTNTTINTMIKAAIPNTMPKTSLLDFLGGVGP